MLPSMNGCVDALARSGVRNDAVVPGPEVRTPTREMEPLVNILDLGKGRAFAGRQ